MNADTPPLGAILESFFTDYLRLQKGLRPNSIKSYADAMRLLLQFAAESSGKKLTQLGLDDLHADAVLHFLASLEERRHNAPQSRNQRLAAILTFFEHVGRRLPERLGQAQKVTAIPRKRAQFPETVFLERDEIERTLAGLGGSRSALRDRTLLLFSIHGARVQEQQASVQTTFTSIRIRVCTFTVRVTSGGCVLSGRRQPLCSETAFRPRAWRSERTSAGLHEPKASGPHPVRNLQDRAALPTEIVKRGSDGQLRRVSPHTGDTRRPFIFSKPASR